MKDLTSVMLCPSWLELGDRNARMGGMTTIDGEVAQAD